jgi:WD40 repeat protein
LAVIGPGLWEAADGVKTGTNVSAINVYEVTPAASSGLAGGPVKALAFSSDGGKLAACGAVWQVTRHGDRSALIPLEAGAAAPQDHYFAGGGRLWAVRSPPRWGEPFTLSQVFPEKQDYPLSWVEFGSTTPITFAASPDGKKILMGWTIGKKVPGGGANFSSENAQLELYDVPQRKRERIWVKGGQGGESHYWSLLLFSPDGRRAVVSGIICGIWDVENGFPSRSVAVLSASTVGLLGSPLGQGRLPAASALFPGRIHVRPSVLTNVSPDSWSGNGVLAAAFGPDGRRLYTAADKGHFEVIDVELGLIRLSWDAPQATARALALSPDGSMLASAGDDKLIHLWDATSGRELVRWQPHPSGATTLAFHPDGKVLASGSEDGTVKLWDLPFIRKELAAIGLDWASGGGDR